MTTRLTWLLGTLVAVVACADGARDPNTTPQCGDGVVAGSEQCDDGNTASGDGCSASCTTEVPAAVCGNMMVETGEECDDGNMTSGDGCSETCTTETPAAGTCEAPYQLTLTANAMGNLEGTGMGDTTGGTSQVVEAACDGGPAGNGNDHVWQFTLTDTRDVGLQIADSTTFDSVLRLMAAPCDVTTEREEFSGADGCSDAGFELEEEVLIYLALPAGTYYAIVDGYDETQAGTYTLNVIALPTTCGNGALDPLEVCDDGGLVPGDGCDAKCEPEPGYNCDGAEPTVCTLSGCGDGVLDAGEECDDDNLTDGDRCSSTCTLEYDILEVEPNNTTAQVLSAGSHLIRGALTANDVDLYTFTLAAPATVEIETYNAIDLQVAYDGVGDFDKIDCVGDLDTVITLSGTAGTLATDDDDGAAFCSYIGPNDSALDSVGDIADPTQGVLPAGTYTIRVALFEPTDVADRYIVDLKITPAAGAAVPPAIGDLVLNEVMIADNVADTNCDGSTTNTVDEFVELVNVSAKTLDLTGVTISDAAGLRHTFAPGPTGSMILAPGKAVVVWGGGSPACPGVTNWFTASVGFLGLNDTGETITVKSAGMTPVTLLSHVFPAATLTVSFNLSPDVTGTAYVLHDAVTGAVGNFSPGKRANNTAF